MSDKRLNATILTRLGEDDPFRQTFLLQDGDELAKEQLAGGGRFSQSDHDELRHIRLLNRFSGLARLGRFDLGDPFVDCIDVTGNR